MKMTMSADANVLDQARARLAWERARLTAPRAVRPPGDVVWRPTPTRRECNLKAADPAAITMLKLWDLSPVDPMAFDPTPPPSGPPVNTALPQIQLLDGIEIGDTIICTTGSWTGSSPTYARQWLRTGASIPGETAPSYTLVAADLGLMVGCVVIATDAGGSTSVNAAEVGPITPPTPAGRKRRREARAVPTGAR